MKPLCASAFVVVFLAAVSAHAESPTLLIETSAPRGVDAGLLSEARVVAGFGDGSAVVAAESGGFELAANRKRATSTAGHPPYDNHQTSLSISLGAKGALVFLRDAGRGIEIVRYNPKTDSWAAVTRPLGFVLDDYAALPDGRVVFGQKRKAWFVFDPASNAFETHELPDTNEPCPGAMGPISKHEALSVGAREGVPCTLALDTKRGTWRELPPPPRAVCGALTAWDGNRLWLLGGRASCQRGNANDEVGAMVFDVKQGTWKTLPDAPTSLSRDIAGVTAKRGVVAAWKFQPDGIRVLSFRDTAKGWVDESLPMRFFPQAIGEVSPGKWLVTGKNTASENANETILVDLTFVPKPSSRDLASREKVLSGFRKTAPPKDVDWSSATDDEKRHAIREGHGSVERWMPPSVDPKTKLKREHGMWVFSLDESVVTWEVPANQCDAFIAKMRTRWPTREVGTKPWSVALGDNFARIGRHDLYDTSDACSLKTDCDGDYHTIVNTPLSLVGPLFTVSRATSVVGNCGDAVTTEVVETLDLRTHQPAVLTLMVEEASLFDALKRTRALKGRLVDAPTLDVGLAALADLDPKGFRSYAFFDWDPKRGLVGMRIYYDDPKTASLAHVDVWVKPRAEFAEHFESASRGEGFYLGNRRL